MSVFLDGQAPADRSAILSALQSEQVHLAWLVELEFASGAVRMSNENVPFNDGTNTWVGMGDLIGMSAVSGGPGELAPAREYQLGIPRELLEAGEIGTGGLGRLPELVGSPAEYRNRQARLLGQVFSDSDTEADGRPSPVGTPFVLDFGLMDRVSISWSVEGATLALGVESILSRKKSPVYGMLTHRDQLSRYAGDKGLRFLPEIATGVLPTWTSW